MDYFGWIQLALFVGLLVALTKPMGLYLVQVSGCAREAFSGPCDRSCGTTALFLGSCGAPKEQDWKQYGFAMLLFSVVSCLFTYAILRLQHILPLNPQGFGAVSPDLAFNTAVSFTTNTNWQATAANRPCPTSPRWWAQLPQLRLRGHGDCDRCCAGAGHCPQSTKTLGNFWIDLVRTTLYLLLPICVVFAVFLVSQGMIQNFKPYEKCR